AVDVEATRRAGPPVPVDAGLALVTTLPGPHLLRGNAQRSALPWPDVAQPAGAGASPSRARWGRGHDVGGLAGRLAMKIEDQRERSLSKSSTTQTSDSAPLTQAI